MFSKPRQLLSKRVLESCQTPEQEGLIYSDPYWQWRRIYVDSSSGKASLLSPIMLFLHCRFLLLRISIYVMMSFSVLSKILRNYSFLFNLTNLLVLMVFHLHSRMPRSTAWSIAPSLQAIFQLPLELSVMTGNMPGLFLFSKKVTKTLPSNYRPISILLTVSNVWERHIHSLVFSFLSENSLISDHQWGFMPRWSTISALCSIIHNWLGVFEDKNEICSVFLKAFDSVPHAPLLDRLLSYHLNPCLVAGILLVDLRLLLLVVNNLPGFQ